MAQQYLLPANRIGRAEWTNNVYVRVSIPAGHFDAHNQLRSENPGDVSNTWPPELFTELVSFNPSHVPGTANGHVRIPRIRFTTFDQNTILPVASTAAWAPLSGSYNAVWDVAGPMFRLVQPGGTNVGAGPNFPPPPPSGGAGGAGGGSGQPKPKRQGRPKGAHPNPKSVGVGSTCH